MTERLLASCLQVLGKTQPYAFYRNSLSDAMGVVIHPIHRPDGQLLEKDDEGRYVNARGEQIELDDFGRPIGRLWCGSLWVLASYSDSGDDGQVLPVNNQGQYVYLEGKEGIGEIVITERPTSQSLTVIGPDGIPLPTDAQGRIVDRDQQPLPTNQEGLLIGPDGSPLPTNSLGQYVASEEGYDTTPHVLPTDGMGQWNWTLGRILNN